MNDTTATAADTAADETEVPPRTVKRIEILRKDADVPEVHYADSVGYFDERGQITLYGPLYPRRGYTRYLDVSDAVDVFVEDVPASDVPALPDVATA